MQASIVGVAAAFDIATVLQFVDIGNDAAWQQVKLRAERLLAATLVSGDGPQDSDVRRRQVDGGHLFGEHHGGVVPDLGQQKGNAIAAIGG